jgi:predicted dehydrogenase/threonine dehydrogenase-like Zn-dependent dehydrogenase
MKQVLQNLGTGETLLAEVPRPHAGPGFLSIETRVSLVSLGTEKMLLDFGRGGWLEKARLQPDKVKQVLQKIRTDGLWTTVEAVRAKLDQPIALGYCNVGVVAEMGAGKSERYEGLSVGDRVVGNGPHAEVVALPRNLAVKVPDAVRDEAAAFTVVGAIGLQGIRLLQPTLGEQIVVSGLGLIGLLCVQMLRAHGCRVLGIDLDPLKLELARRFGAETVDLSAGQDPVAAAEAWTQGQGVDGVLITASTKSNEVAHQSATMCRQRGRIVLVGVVGLNLRRDDFYKKELTFQVSCSYGPGRYDPRYEKEGLDYPIGFVRWTEQRNFEAVLQLMTDGRLDVEPLISHRFPFDRALEAYKVLGSGKALGILLDYRRPTTNTAVETQPSAGGANKFARVVDIQQARQAPGVPVVGFIGAGNFTTRILLPVLKAHKVRLRTIASSTGVSGTHAAKKFGFERSATEAEAVLSDPEIDAVFITTPHHTHADLVCRALAAGKQVFVEKPLAVTSAEIEHVSSALVRAAGEKGDSLSHASCLMVGLNRRFSPHTVWMKQALAATPGTKAVVVTVNAGAIPAEHWTQDPNIGGGRITGEACHFIDLARHLIGRPITAQSASFLGGQDGRLGDCATIQLCFDDGSLASIHYLANGHKDFPKERIEVFTGGKILRCENFLKSSGYGVKGGVKTWNQDKGHAAEVTAFLQAIRSGGAWPIPAEELLEVAAVTLQVAMMRGRV